MLLRWDVGEVIPGNEWVAITYVIGSAFPEQYFHIQQSIS